MVSGREGREKAVEPAGNPIFSKAVTWHRNLKEESTM